MKAMKIYGIHGLLEWHGSIHSNGASMHLDFTNGSTTAYGVAPATYMTKNELTQHFIEHSDEFKSGRIKLVRAVEIEDPTAKTKDGKGIKEYPEVSKTQDAIEVLKGLGVDAANVKTKADAKKYAEELNISFPNLK